MFEKLLLVTICLWFANASLDAGVQNAALDAFVNASIYRFRDATIDLGFDPLPIDMEPIDIDVSYAVVDLNGTVWDVKQSGLSTLYLYQLSSDLTGSLLTWTKMESFILSGQYNLSGTFLSTIPVNVAGEWTLNISNNHYVDMSATFSLVDGFIVIRPEDVNQNIHMEIEEVKFPELEAALTDFADDVVRQLGDHIRGRVQQTVGYTIAGVVYDYLNKDFAETSLADIIWGPSTGSTPSASTTVDPCAQSKDYSKMLWNLLEGRVVEEKVLSVNALVPDDSSEFVEVTVVSKYLVPNVRKS